MNYFNPKQNPFIILIATAITITLILTQSQDTKMYNKELKELIKLCETIIKLSEEHEKKLKSFSEIDDELYNTHKNFKAMISYMSDITK